MKKQKGFGFLTAVAFLGCMISVSALRAETVPVSEEAKMPVSQAKEWIRILYASSKISATRLWASAESGRFAP